MSEIVLRLTKEEEAEILKMLDYSNVNPLLLRRKENFKLEKFLGIKVEVLEDD